MRRVSLIVISLCFLVFFAGCDNTGEEDTPHFAASDLVGKWQRENSQEYWRFDSGYAGETWDESEDVQEGEGTRLGWGVTGNVLSIELYGEMGQVVPYDYTLLELNDSVLKWKDNYSHESQFVKVRTKS